MCPGGSCPETRTPDSKPKLSRKPVPEIFCRLRTASTNCLQSSLGVASGHCQDPPDSMNLTGSCMQIMRLGRQIRQQLMDMKTELQLRSSSKENIDASLSISLKMAHVPLEREVVSVRNKEIALRRQSYHAMLNDRKGSLQEHAVMAILSHSTDICKKIQAVHLSNQQLEEHLVDVQHRRMEMRIKQQQLFKQLKTYEERNHKLHNLEMKTLVLGRENMESVYNQVIVIQETFQVAPKGTDFLSLLVW
uniref:Uncharacterized protein n=1 Tax=Leptobrachium leishanense TaxID=445787 RepID=A0A8C5PUJ9_9ANUR